MPIIQSRNAEQFTETLRDYSQKVFLVSLLPTLGIFGYLLYGLFTGQLADASQGAKAASHVVPLIQQLSNWMNISLIFTIISAIILFWETDALGYIFLALGAFLAYGLDFSIKFLFGQEGAKLTSGPASEALLHEFWIAAMMIGAPGVAMIVRHMIVRIVDSRNTQDLSNVTIGKNVGEQQRPQALIGAFAACWQLAYCRDGIRVKCPIYHARTKCWKERVGCMCEENIILLAMGGEEPKKGIDMTADGAAAAPTNSGFVPIGDLITKHAETTRATIPTRQGPRGVRLPDNPHLTDGQKRERCRNCVIYNEHQRQKYQLLSAPVTLSVPALVFWQFDNIKELLKSLLNGLDSLIGHLSFSGGHGASEITTKISGNLPMEVLLIICITLVMMTWAQRLLEYCIFKIKI